MYLYAERDVAYTLCTVVTCRTAATKIEKPVTFTPSRPRRDTSTRAQFRQGTLDNDTQKTLVHRAVRRPDHHVPLRERVRVDRDPIYGHLRHRPVLLAHGQLFQSI